MIKSVIMIGAILVPVLLILSVVLLKATPKTKYIGYFPGFIGFAAGLFLLLFATILDKIEIMGAGLGGWGIALLFAATISLVVTSIFDAYAQPDSKARA